jgi:hypothetical protein
VATRTYDSAMNHHVRQPRQTRTPTLVVAALACVLTLTVALFGQAGAASAGSLPVTSSNVDKVATALVNRMWTLAQNNDRNGLRKFINRQFQAQDADQPRWNKRQFINVLVNKEDLTSYTLSDLRATRSGNTIVVTYTAAASQIVNGKPLSGDPKPRLTVFVQSPTTHKYTAISHSSFNVPTDS